MPKHYIMLALLLSTAATSLAQGVSPESRVQQKTVAADGTPVLIAFREGAAKYGASQTAQALREQLQLSPDDQLVRMKTETDALGFTHEKHQQYYRGIKVEHATYTVHTRAGKIESLTGHVRHVGQLSISPTLPAPAALERALAFVGAKQYKWQVPQEEAGLKQRTSNPGASYRPQGELVIVADSPNKPVLAWKFDVYAHEPVSRAYVYVDAATGKVVLQDIIMKSLTGPFDTRYSGTRQLETDVNPGGGFRLRDYSRSSGV